MFTTSNQWVLIGLTSYGIGCASPTTAGVDTRVAYYQSWISTNTGNSYTLATSSNSATIDITLRNMTTESSTDGFTSYNETSTHATELTSIHMLHMDSTHHDASATSVDMSTDMKSETSMITSIWEPTASTSDEQSEPTSIGVVSTRTTTTTTTTTTTVTQNGGTTICFTCYRLCQTSIVIVFLQLFHFLFFVC